MPAGHDFDALLIGALYGELSAVEESRLQAHLAAHPADQQIYNDLTRTREAIRAGVAAAFVEPPQAISALLLQEAARRAPHRSAESIAASESGSRWMRWLASLLAHPGLAAAAMAVLVVGVFGTMYLRGERKFAESTDSSAAESAAPAAESGAAAGSGSTAEPDLAKTPDTDGDLSRLSSNAAVAGREESPTLLAQEPQLRAGLDERARVAPSADPAAAPASPAAGDSRGPIGAYKEDDSYSVGLADGGGEGRAQRRDTARPADAPAPASKPTRPAYLEAKVADDIELKDYDDASQPADAKADRKAERARGEPAKEALAAKPAPPPRPAPKAEMRPDVDGSLATGARSRTMDESEVDSRAEQEKPLPSKNRAKKGGATLDQDKSVEPAEAAAPPPPAVFKTVPRVSGQPSSPNPAPRPGPGPASTPATTSSGKTSTGATPGIGSSSRPAGGAATAAPVTPAPTSSPVAAREAVGAAPQVAQSQKQVYDDAWARSEHVRLVRLVRASKCSEAATVARVLSERAPRYYQDQVANDRSLRVCSAAIRDQLNLQSEQAKRKLSAPARATEADEAPVRK